MTTGTISGRQRLAILGGAGLLMLLPVLPERISGAVNWDVGDFMFLAILLAGLGIAFEVAARVADRNAYRAGASVAITAALLSTWINLSVGVIGSENNPANLIYAGIIGVGVIGSILGRFKPFGMARAMAAAAFAQMLAFAVALAAGLGFTGPITIFFTALWLIAAWLFSKSARANASTAASAGFPATPSAPG